MKKYFYIILSLTLLNLNLYGIKSNKKSKNNKTKIETLEPKDDRFIIKNKAGEVILILPGRYKGNRNPFLEKYLRI